MSSKKVLVAFDSSTMRRLVAKSLKEDGYTVIEAKDGIEALTLLHTERPDAVVVYIELPVISGYNISRIVKNANEMSDMVVIICALEENSVYNFWVENSLSDGLFVPEKENLSELSSMLERNLQGIEKKSKPGRKKKIEAPDQTKLIETAISAFDKELFNLYTIQSAYKNGISEFNISRLVEELAKSISGIYNYDVLGVIIKSKEPIEYYAKNHSMSQDEFDDFIDVCHSEYMSLHKKSGKISWQKNRQTILPTNQEEQKNVITKKVKTYETLPRELSDDIPFTIHIASFNNVSINPRTRERLNFLINIYSKLFIRAIDYNAAKDNEVKMRKAFSHFIPPAIINQMLVSGDETNSTVGEKREVAILICDIRNFTTISEINEAEKVVEFLNSYFATMGRIIKKHGGTIDKFMGDAIMALFGAPESYEDNGNRAANAALEMRHALNDMEITLNLPVDYVFEIGTGIHYGATIVGSIGSEEKKEYTVIGDNVNIASRIEGLTKLYGVPIIISESVKKDLHDGQYVRHLDTVKVKGKSNSVAIYELNSADTETDPIFLDYYEKGMNQYSMGNFEIASEYFSKAIKKCPSDKASKVLLERCKVYIHDRPENWDGAFALTTK
ncbi:MAG: response regulator [Treponema sp.]|nr:response regulator [Treponema sp.]